MKLDHLDLNNASDIFSADASVAFISVSTLVLYGALKVTVIIQDLASDVLEMVQSITTKVVDEEVKDILPVVSEESPIPNNGFTLEEDGICLFLLSLAKTHSASILEAINDHAKYLLQKITPAIYPPLKVELSTLLSEYVDKLDPAEDANRLHLIIVHGDTVKLLLIKMDQFSNYTCFMHGELTISNVENIGQEIMAYFRDYVLDICNTATTRLELKLTIIMVRNEDPMFLFNPFIPGLDYITGSGFRRTHNLELSVQYRTLFGNIREFYLPNVGNNVPRLLEYVELLKENILYHNSFLPPIPEPVPEWMGDTWTRVCQNSQLLRYMETLCRVYRVGFLFAMVQTPQELNWELF